MNEKKRNFILKSTYKAIKKRIAVIREKLTNEIPKILRETYDSDGYWHDNAPWQEALREQQMLNQELYSLVDALKDVSFIEDMYFLCDKDKVTVGKSIEIKDIVTKKSTEYSVVGSLDVVYNPNSKKYRFLSCKTPFAKSLLGKSVGERMTVKLPGGTKVFLISEIKPLTILSKAK